MRTTLAYLLLAFASLTAQGAALSADPVPAPPVAPVSAQPPCYPSSVGGTGSPYVVGITVDGGYIGWWCPIDGGWEPFVLVSLPGYVIKHPPFNPDVLKLAKAYWDENVRDLEMTPELVVLSQLASNALVGVKPAAVTWVVAKNGDKTTRPSFAVVNGVRSFSSKTTVAVGAPCDMSTKLVEGAVTFGGVGPSLVAVCSKNP